MNALLSQPIETAVFEAELEAARMERSPRACYARLILIAVIGGRLVIADAW